MRRIRIFAAFLACIWLAAGSHIAIAFTPVPERVPIKTQPTTERPPPSNEDGDDWLWLRTIGGSALAMAFLIAFVYLIIVRRPLTMYRVPPKSTAARPRKRGQRPSRAVRRSTPGARNRHA
jgi:hypothetical protein